jgi:NDP-sugar pyrophosphorylase family protein
VHHLGQQIIDYLKENEGFGCKVLISDEREALLETGGGLLKAVELLGEDEPVLVCNVDILSNIDLRQLVDGGARRNSAESRTDESHPWLATVVVSDRETQRYLLFDGEGVLKGWMNRKTGEYKPQEAKDEDLVPLAFSGMQIVSPRFFDELRQTREEKGEKFSLIDAYLSVVARKAGIIRAYVPKEYRMMDVGKIDQLDEAERFAKNLEGC